MAQGIGMLIPILCFIAGLFILIERISPSTPLPVVPRWWQRIVVVNLAQVAIVVLAGMAWDRWFSSASLLHLSELLPHWASGLIAYFISTFIYYWWHRWRHESAFWWRVCHQLHHSASRIEVLASFYKHPLEILINSLISGALVYGILGCSTEAGAIYTFLTAVAEYFYHWNIRTPRWLGRFIQRPESHRLHHQRDRHTDNYADLPLWDMLFGTYRNPKGAPKHCGFTAEREAQFTAMLKFQTIEPSVLTLAPTCLGCKKRTACMAQRMAKPTHA